MRRFNFVVVSLLALVVIVASPASAARFRFGTHAPTVRPVPTAGASSGLGVSDWVNCGVTLTPATTNKLAFQLLLPTTGGGSIVAWTDARSNAKYHCAATRLDGTGNHVSGWLSGGNSISVSDSSQLVASSASDNGGGAFLLFTNADTADTYTHDAYLQHLTASGTVAAGYPTVGKTLITGDMNVGGILPDGSGGVFFGWSSPGGSSIRLTRLDASGTATAGWPAGGIDTQVPDGVNGEPALDGSGGVYLTWSTLTDVKIQRFASTGVASGWPAGGVTVGSPGAEVDPRIVLLSNGDALVSWVDPGTSHVFAMRINASGSVNGSWPAGGKQISTAAGPQDNPRVVPDGVGGALISWAEGIGFPFPFSQPYVQRLTSVGGVATGWPAAGLALSSSSTQYLFLDLQSDGANGAIAVWTDLRSLADIDLYAQRALAAGTVDPGWTADGVGICTATGDQIFPEITTDGAGGAIVAYLDYTDINNPQVRVSRLLADGTVSALASLVEASVEPGSVRLHWYTPDGSVQRATVERAEAGGEFVAVGDVLADGAGHLRYDDRDVTAGTTYQYRLAVQDGAATVYLGQVTVRVPSSVSFGIEGLRPNPAEGEVSVVFALESAAPARLEMLDVAGRRVLAREVGMLGPGQHVLRLEQAASLPAGIYVLRLTQSGREVVTRAALVR